MIIIAISLPKTYKVDITLSPESGQNGSSSNLAGMASMLGIGGIGGTSQDAVNSTMFPDLIKSTPFILEMYNVQVTPLKSKRAILLSEYIETQKKPWWSYVLGLPGKTIGGIISLFSSEKKIDENMKIFSQSNKQKPALSLYIYINMCVCVYIQTVEKQEKNLKIYTLLT